jgi:hypothetical protein
MQKQNSKLKAKNLASVLKSFPQHSSATVGEKATFVKFINFVSFFAALTFDRQEAHTIIFDFV